MWKEVQVTTILCHTFLLASNDIEASNRQDSLV